MSTVKVKFSLGQLVATRGVVNSIPNEAVMKAVRRHINGDWGNVCKEDWQTNDEAVENEMRILSSYEHDGIKFWIITEWDRSVTTVLLPEEY